MLKRLVEAALTALVASVLVFLLVHFVPGDPAQAMLGEKANPTTVENLRQELGLEEPLIFQLGLYFKRLATFDLGRSIRSGRPVIEEIRARLPATLELSIAGMIIAAFLGILLGVLAAKRPGGFIDSLLGATSVLGLSMPIFFLGLLMILVFGLWLEWFPLSGRLSYQVSYQPITGLVLVDAILTGNWKLFLTGLHHLILPACALATVPMSLLARLTRSSLLESLRMDYIRTARSKGQVESLVFFKHALRNALLPVATMIGFQFGLLLGGAILTENVFAWPGIGRWIVFSVEGRDYPAVQGGILCFAFGIILVMALNDMILKKIDPRLKAN